MNSIAILLSPGAKNLDLFTRVPPVSELIVRAEKERFDVPVVTHMLLCQIEFHLLEVFVENRKVVCGRNPVATELVFSYRAHPGSLLLGGANADELVACFPVPDDKRAD